MHNVQICQNLWIGGYFVYLAGLVTYATIDLIFLELDLARKWVEKVKLRF